MTDILPPAGWPNVRQLETNEFATGGANGNMNEQAKSLAARSELLKQYAALPYKSKTGGYALNERVQLATGDIVRSTIPSNVNNPNENMTGWVKANDASQIFDASGLNQQQVNNSVVATIYAMDALRAYKSTIHGKVINLLMHSGEYRGGGFFVFDSQSLVADDNGMHIKPTAIPQSSKGRWVRQTYGRLSTDDFGLNLRSNDVTATLQLMDSLADEITVNEGEYLISDFKPSKKYVFEDNAWFKANTTSKSNAIIVQSGLIMENPRVRVNATASPLDGDYGNAFRIGTYRQPDNLSVNVSDVTIINPKVELVHPDNISQGFEILGNAYNIRIESPSVKGRGFGIICHWGAFNVGGDGHGSSVSRTYHPHNITITNPEFSSADNVSNWTGRMQTGIILSACYNINITNVRTDGLVNSVYVMAGDVYAQEAVDRDKYNIYTNINIDGIEIDNYKEGATPVTVLGITDTRRTSSAPTAAVSRDQNARVRIKNINFKVPRSTDTNNLINIRYAKNVELSANFSGGYLHGGALCYFDTCINSSIDIFGFAKNGVITRSLRNCNVNLYSDRYPTSNVAGEVGVECRSLSYSGSMSASGGGTVLKYIPTQDVVVFDGTGIFKDGVLLGYTTESRECKANVESTLKCTPLLNGLSFSEKTNIMVLYNSNVNYTGLVSGYYRNFYGTNLKDSKISMDNKYSHSTPIVLDGDVCSGVTFAEGVVSEANHSGATASVACYVSATSVRSLAFNRVKFDPHKENPKLQGCIEVVTSNNSGISVTNCSSGARTTRNISLSIPVATVNDAYQLNTLGNNFNDFNLNLIASPVGCYIGGNFVGYTREIFPPPTGFWRVGDKVYKKVVTVGQPSGWVCTTGGTSAVWTPLSNI